MIGLLRDQFNPTVVSARQLAAEFGASLAEVPGQVDAPSPVFAPDSPQAAAMHHLVGVLRSRSGADGADVTLITSPSGSPDARSILRLILRSAPAPPGRACFW